MTSDRSSPPTPAFADRTDAGRRLAVALRYLRGPEVTVLGLPRGGVPVASEVAKALAAPLDVIVVRKLGLPSRSEVAMGAIGEGGVEVLDRQLIANAQVTDERLRSVERREQRRVIACIQRFRCGRGPLDLYGRTAIIVDDGLATGATARVACCVARDRGADRVVVAVPIGPPGVVQMLPEADEVVCLQTPTPFISVGSHYRDFHPTSDDEVVDLVNSANAR